MTKQLDRWKTFSYAVYEHIVNYVIPQYGDEGEDLATDYTIEDCIKQVEKYTKRFGRSSRPGERQRDLIKMAHYTQKAWAKQKALEDGEASN